MRAADESALCHTLHEATGSSAKRIQLDESSVLQQVPVRLAQFARRSHGQERVEEMTPPTESRPKVI